MYKTYITPWTYKNNYSNQTFINIVSIPSTVKFDIRNDLAEQIVICQKIIGNYNQSPIIPVRPY
jgi:hypothetical protein